MAVVAPTKMEEEGLFFRDEGGAVEGHYFGGSHYSTVQYSSTVREILAWNSLFTHHHSFAIAPGTARNFLDPPAPPGPPAGTMSYYFKKPENALRRVHELYNAGKKQLGIEILHSVLTARRHKQWTKTHEQIMKLYLRICVDLRKKLFARDGLHTYRSLCQREAPASLEVVVNYLIDHAELKCREARKLSGLKLNEIDTEQESAAESIMLNAVTSEGDKERVDRELLLPWIRFLWECFRLVLDVVKNNNRLFDVYHRMCARAYEYCLAYKRTYEFRKLQELIQRHLHDQQKYQKSDLESGKKPFMVILTADVYERHLETRFLQLKAATELQVWNQAYRTVEEIHSIMALIDRPIKPEMMAAYYKSLSDMFLVSRSYLFHAYAWLRYYNLNQKQNKALGAADLTRMASALTLAALAVPVVKEHESISSYANDEADKLKRMTSLLGYSFHPSRELLIAQIASMGLHEHCEDWVGELFTLLENDFRPQDLVQRVTTHLKHMRESEDFSAYAPGIEKLVVIRLCQHLSKVSI